MFRHAKNIIRSLTPRFVLESRKAYMFNHYHLVSHSFEGEDLILNRFFENRRTGFYIDVGAHHPVRFSNTYFFYKKGWRGINLDAMPGSMSEFKIKRPLDINLEIPISNTSEEMDYYIFNEPALNGFSGDLSKDRESLNKGYKIEKVIKLKCQSLASVLDAHLPKNQQIDFISIDVEGFDLDVLKSNNWLRYKPEYIIVEILSNDLVNIQQNDVYKFLKSVGYAFSAKSINSCFFKRIEN